MNPDVLAAVNELFETGVLTSRAAVKLRRVASGSLVSVREELRALLWVGVFLITSGVGLLVREHLDRIGPLAIAIVLGVVAVGCLGWAWRRQTSTSFVFDTVLLLGALLTAADLAFIEVKFTPLGGDWPWHLLMVAAFYALLAFRFDSAALFSLSLTAFAAWRGVSIAGVATPWGGVADGDRMLIEALLCGLLFLALGRILERSRAKPQFQPVASWLGWILIVGALAFRLGIDDGRPIVGIALVGCGAVQAWFAWNERSLGQFALGTGAAATGVGGLLMDVFELINGDEKLFLATVIALAVAVIVIVLRAHRALRASS